MNQLTPDTWTVMARSTKPGRWSYMPGFVPSDVDKPGLVVMHRKQPFGWELVGRLAGPQWERWQKRGQLA